MNETKQALVKSIQQFIFERGVIIEDTDIENYNFVAAGELDSFEILSLIMNLETEFDISVPPELLVSPENAKIGSLASALMKLNDSY
ncbi:acyl carrier protein [Pseudoalteromonas sp. SWXJZ10B]|uniref:acyl carrier protein n=1 Tax=Pseudoalteromonas sp. SWXJZ10B TaxID=2792063 RepID=UPI0018CDC226|nr:acyl carrier protein [Pseudoalteromonas sp. SWXJZ10B]MBH0042958.1 acyl carrier protein [Pseudoalteromonas sp. SWXJZ10B]